MISIEGPPGLSDVAKQKMVADVPHAADEAFHVGDVRVWLREYAPELYAQDGVIGAPVRPIATLEASELGNIETKRPWWSGSTLHSPRPVRASQIQATSWSSPTPIHLSKSGGRAGYRATVPTSSRQRDNSPADCSAHGPQEGKPRARRARSDVKHRDSSHTPPTAQQP
jgi:hypothetical protein